MIPGWPYSVVAALEPGGTSWTLPLDAVRLGPADDATEVSAAQIREVVTRLIQAGHWHGGDPDILIVLDAGYDLTRLAWLLAGLPVEVLGRLRSDRVMYFPAPAREPGTNGRPVRHGAALKLADPKTWPAAAVSTAAETARYGTARAMAWGRLHQRLASRAGWEDYDGELPVIEGTLIRLAVSHLPGDRSPEPVWLWTTAAAADADAVNRAWQAFLRRFDIEHTFRFFKQALGWTRPRLRDPAAADRWTWLVIAAYAQLRLARHLAADLRLPWQRPLPSRPPDSRQGPARVPEHPPDAARSGRRAETRQTRSRPPARIEKPPARPSSRRGQDRQTSRSEQNRPQTGRLNNKLSVRAGTSRELGARAARVCASQRVLRSLNARSRMALIGGRILDDAGTRRVPNARATQGHQRRSRWSRPYEEGCKTAPFFSPTSDLHTRMDDLCASSLSRTLFLTRAESASGSHARFVKRYGQ